MIFEASLESGTKYFPKNSSLTTTCLLGILSTITLDVYNLLRNRLIHESMKFGEYLFVIFMFKVYLMFVSSSISSGVEFCLVKQTSIHKNSELTQTFE